MQKKAGAVKAEFALMESNRGESIVISVPVR